MNVKTIKQPMTESHACVLFHSIRKKRRILKIWNQCTYDSFYYKKWKGFEFFNVPRPAYFPLSFVSLSPLSIGRASPPVLTKSLSIPQHISSLAMVIELERGRGCFCFFRGVGVVILANSTGDSKTAFH